MTASHLSIFAVEGGNTGSFEGKELPFFGLTHSRILQLLPQKAFECGVEYFRRIAEDAKLKPQDALIIYSYEGQNVRHTILIRQLLIVESPKAFSRMDPDVRASEYHRARSCDRMSGALNGKCRAFHLPLISPLR